MSKEKIAAVILVPGLGDDKPSSTNVLQFATRNWQGQGYDVHTHFPHWRDGEDLAPKLERLLQEIDGLAAQYDHLSIIGTSAGASLAFLASLERSEILDKAINVYGRLREGKHQLRSLDRMARTSRAFHQAVKAFEKRTSSITPEQLSRLMTVQSFIGDELVPKDTSYLPGAHNVYLPIPEHMLGIFCTLHFPKILFDFLSCGIIEE